MRRGGGGCRDDVGNNAATKGTCPSPMRHRRGLQLGYQGLVVESCRLRCGKRGTRPHSLESVQTRGDQCCCADNGIARASVMFLEHRCGVSVVDRRGLCRPRCNAAQGPIEALLCGRGQRKLRGEQRAVAPPRVQAERGRFRCLKPTGRWQPWDETLERQGVRQKVYGSVVV
jgi:hypothetical protein